MAARARGAHACCCLSDHAQHGARAFGLLRMSSLSATTVGFFRSFLPGWLILSLALGWFARIDCWPWLGGPLALRHPPAPLLADDEFPRELGAADRAISER